LAKKIIFPVTNAVEREKLRNYIIDSVADYMNADITTKTIAVLEVVYPENRQDLDTLFSALLNNIIKKSGS
jgi:hypothetical protein